MINYFSVNYQLFFFLAEERKYLEIFEKDHTQISGNVLFSLCGIMYKPYFSLNETFSHCYFLFVCLFFKKVMFLWYFCCQKIMAYISEHIFCLQSRHG